MSVVIVQYLIDPEKPLRRAGSYVQAFIKRSDLFVLN